MTSLPRGRAGPAAPRRVLILGAAGRDFHNFNVVFRDDPASIVVGFTATQIPGIAGRRYPAALAGPRYPDGIPIDDEAALEALCRSREVDEVVCALVPAGFAGVGQFYRDFRQTEDDEVVAILKEFA